LRVLFFVLQVCSFAVVRPWDNIDTNGWQQAIFEQNVQDQQRAFIESVSPMLAEVQAELATGSASQNKPKRLLGQTVGNGEPSNRATKRNKITVEMKPPRDDDINLPDATMEDVEKLRRPGAVAYSQNPVQNPHKRRGLT
jgi:hypothetical protein